MTKKIFFSHEQTLVIKSIQEEFKKEYKLNILTLLNQMPKNLIASQNDNFRKGFEAAIICLKKELDL